MRKARVPLYFMFITFLKGSKQHAKECWGEYTTQFDIVSDMEGILQLPIIKYMCHHALVKSLSNLNDFDWTATFFSHLPQTLSVNCVSKAFVRLIKII
uniref:Uncharacterized protein n=1 Tax=Arion vulgaris TaxID=1028688 RepID=A0A0B7BH38_9EUPU